MYPQEKQKKPVWSVRGYNRQEKQSASRSSSTISPPWKQGIIPGEWNKILRELLLNSNFREI
jgi:hypothetical protein